MPQIIDTSLLLRYLTKDDQHKAAAVEILFKDVQKKLVIPDIVIAELVWVLSSPRSLYKIGKNDIVIIISGLLSLPENIIINKTLIGGTLEVFKTTNLSWIDCYLVALAKLNNYQGIYSYDRGFDKIPGIRRLEPK